MERVLDLAIRVVILVILVLLAVFMYQQLA
jgi:hypothetical protein